MKSKAEGTAGSLDWTIVKEALRRAIPAGVNVSGRSEEKHDLEISVLINDIFGGEILRQRNRDGWHFYNRIYGKRVDLAAKEESGLSDNPVSVKDSGSTVVACSYFEQNDYTSFFLRFVTALEEAVGLGRYRTA